MNNNTNNEGERTAQEYVDTTLRSSHYNQTQRIEDATDGNTTKIGSIHIIVLSSLLCIIATWLSCAYVFYNHGSVFYDGDSIAGLRGQLKTTEQFQMEIGITKQRNHQLKKRLFELNESMDIILGILDDRAALLVKSEKSNPLRFLDVENPYGQPHVFTFDKWASLWRPRLLEVAVKLGSTNALEHITKTPNWSLGIPDKLTSKVQHALDGMSNTQLDIEKEMFKKMVSELPPDKKAAWDHFTEMMKKDPEGSLLYIKNKYEKDGSSIHNGDGLIVTMDENF